MKAFVFGATGMAGHTISVYLKEQGHDVTAYSRRHIDFCKYEYGDITDFKNIREIVERNSFDAVINAAGILNQNAEENKSQAVLINTYFPHFLSEITKHSNTKIVHLSTDCVFSGKTGSYSENSFKDGPTFYDRTKALGELDNAKDLTFRNSIIGPDINVNGIGLLNWFMKQNDSINGYTKAIWSGVTTLTLAKAIEKAVDNGLAGIYHLVCLKSISKYDLLKLFNAYFKNNSLTIIPNDSVIIDKSQINTRNDFPFVVPGYKQMVSEMKNWILDHQDLYPHYSIGEHACGSSD